MRSIREIYKVGFGPSSSHTIGPSLAAEMFAQQNPQAALYRVTLYGSLALTGKGHCTDVALKKSLPNREMEIVWKPETFLPAHPNAMLFEALDSNGELIDDWEVYSVGGGDLKDNKERIKQNQPIYKETSLAEILLRCKEEGRQFWEYVVMHEGEEILDFLAKVWEMMKGSIKAGLENEGVLPGALHLGRKAASYYIKSRNSLGTIQSTGTLFSYALAVSEENASGNTVVTAPTCGASGVLPAVLFFLQQDQKISDLRIVRSLATAALIANLTKKNASISGAEVGCQGEIGTACSMAAAAAAQLMGGSPAQIEYAAEMGFEHNLGLTCDPIGGYVQIPCIERNAIAASKAIECAVFSLFSDGRHKISFDQVVQTMYETGKDLQSAYRETSIGGLARNWR